MVPAAAVLYYAALARIGATADAPAAPPAAAAPIALYGASVGFRYDGHGALSAGASSRLLVDYPEPQRSDILDLLFRPSFGAAMPLLKFEIGGDVQSTDGTEPSWRHSRDDAGDCLRGYEAWIIAEAKRRNPGVLTYALAWGVPAWVGNGSYWSAENIAYHVGWLECIRRELNITVDFLSQWNEKPSSPSSYTEALRAALDAAGLATAIIIETPNTIADAIADPSLAAAIRGFGTHYPEYPFQPHPEIFADLAGKSYWASEDFSTVGDWEGASCWGRTLNSNFIRMNMTSTIAWSLLWSVYPGMLCDRQGLMLANSPTAGHYENGGALFTMAHTTQFASPGWRYLEVGPAGGAGELPGGGSYVTLVAPGGAQDGVTVVVESLQGKCLRADGVASVDQNVTFLLSGGGLPGPGASLACWRTTRDAFFVQQPDAPVAADGTVTFFLPADSIMTLSTERSAARGATSAVPASAPFPLPYEDTFDSYDPARDATARFFADVGGSWAVRNGSLTQTVGEAPNANQWDIATGPPFSYLGDPTWGDVTVTASVSFSSAAPRVGGRLGYDERALAVLACNASDGDQLWQLGASAPGFLALPAPRTLPGAPMCLDVAACGSAVDAFTCELDSGGCDPDDNNLRWALRPVAGQPGQVLVASLLGAATSCLTLLPSGATALAPCGAPPAGAQQAWATALPPGGPGGNGSAVATLALASDASRCLGLRPPPPSVYARLCARLAGQAWVGEAYVPSGYCVDLGADARWRLQAGPARGVVAEGALPGGFEPAAPHALALSVAGSSVSAALDGAPLPGAAWVDAQAEWPSGYVGVGSGYHAAAVHSFRVE